MLAVKLARGTAHHATTVHQCAGLFKTELFTKGVRGATSVSHLGATRKARPHDGAFHSRGLAGCDGMNFNGLGARSAGSLHAVEAIGVISFKTLSARQKSWEILVFRIGHVPGLHSLVCVQSGCVCNGLIVGFLNCCVNDLELEKSLNPV